MTTKPASHQEHDMRRAVWLAHVQPSTAGTPERRIEAYQVAEGAGACVVAEYLYAAPDRCALSNTAWSELLSFVQAVKADTLVVLAPLDMARSFGTCVRRLGSLEDAGVRVAFPEDMGLTPPAREDLAKRRAA